MQIVGLSLASGAQILIFAFMNLDEAKIIQIR